MSKSREPLLELFVREHLNSAEALQFEEILVAGDDELGAAGYGKFKEVVVVRVSHFS